MLTTRPRDTGEEARREESWPPETGSIGPGDSTRMAGQCRAPVPVPQGERAMSKSIVGHELVRVLVWAGLDPRFGGPFSWNVVDTDGDRVARTLTPETAPALGALLAALNERTFEEYHGEEHHEEYVHSAPAHDTWSAYEVLALVSHYAYHAFPEDLDQEEFEADDAAMYVSALNWRVALSVPGWDVDTFRPSMLTSVPEFRAAPIWIDASTVPAAGPSTPTRTS